MNRPGNTAVISILLAIILGVAGFFWYQSTQVPVETTNTPVTNTVTNTEVSDVPDAPEVATDQDLATAETTLDQIDVDANASDSIELDGYLQAF